jgi:hypothetical protein
LADEWRGRHHLLEIVEHKQHVLVAQILLEAGGEGALNRFIDAECLGDGRCDQLRIAYRGKRDKIYAITKIVE